MRTVPWLLAPITFSTRRLTLSNSTGLASPFLIEMTNGLLAGARSSAGWKRPFWTVRLSVDSCAPAGMAVRTIDVIATSAIPILDKTFPLWLELDSDLELRALPRKLLEVEVIAGIGLLAGDLRVPRSREEPLARKF